MNAKLSKIDRFFKSESGFLWALLATVTILFTLIVYPNLVVKRHKYKLGDVVQRDIKAQQDFFIEDKEATAANRRQAVEDVLTVYDHDTGLKTNISRRLNQAFSTLRAVIESTPESESPEAANAEAAEETPADTQAVPEDTLPDETSKLHELIWQHKEEFEELLGITVNDGAYRILEKEKFSFEIENLIDTIVGKILTNGVVANKEMLLKEQDKGITLRNVETGEEMNIQSLRRFYGLDQAKTMVRIVGQPILEDINYVLRGLIVDFAQRLISPNITLNRNETNERRKKAAEKIKPFLYQIKTGEMLIREGERVTDFQLRKLEAMYAQVKDEQMITSRLGAALMVICLLLITYLLYVRTNKQIVQSDKRKNILFIAVVLVIFVFLTKISATLADGVAPVVPFGIPTSSMYYAIPLAAGAMTICLFMNLQVALSFALVMAVCTAMIFNNRFDMFLYFFFSSALGAYWMQHCRERIVFIKAGLKLASINIVLVTVVEVFSSDFNMVKLIWDWTFAFAGGVMAGIVTAGTAPLVESAFGYATDIKLLELVNLDRPILRRLMIEASGTYHHSIIVGSLVEAAASAIEANPLLARVCGYYHDIGKIKKPLYFIENQTGGKNKHDKLAPSMSSLILISHVKDGVDIAKRNKLGKAIIDTIQQHHGTSLISYFYEKAKQLKGEENINIDDFRYPGPKPQTREAALVMLADVIEAASRTLENPTPSRIQGLVQNLINKVFSDGQLDNCELTLKDLHNIAKSFIKILDGIYHHRIEYPESSATGSGKGKHGSSDRQPPKQTENGRKEGSGQGTGHLKRLGQS